MDHDARVRDFERLVANRFNVYNSLFLSLPFQQVRRIGVLIPLMEDYCARGLEEGKNPIEILDAFFAQHTDIETEADKIGLTLMAIAGYDPIEAADLWRRMEAQGNGAPPEFLSTHPSGQTRIRNIQSWAPEAKAEARKFGVTNFQK